MNSLGFLLLCEKCPQLTCGHGPLLWGVGRVYNIGTAPIFKQFVGVQHKQQELPCHRCMVLNANACCACSGTLWQPQVEDSIVPEPHPRKCNQTAYIWMGSHEPNLELDLLQLN